MGKKKTTKLKSWEFVKDKTHSLTTLSEWDDPSQFYYQFDGYMYYPAVYKHDMDILYGSSNT